MKPATELYQDILSLAEVARGFDLHFELLCERSEKVWTRNFHVVLRGPESHIVLTVTADAGRHSVVIKFTLANCAIRHEGQTWGASDVYEFGTYLADNYVAETLGRK